MATKKTEKRKQPATEAGPKAVGENRTIVLTEKELFEIIDHLSGTQAIVGLAHDVTEEHVDGSKPWVDVEMGLKVAYRRIDDVMVRLQRIVQPE
jgi:hypothetical protein